MNSTVLLLTGLGCDLKALAIAKAEKLMLSICACTGLSLDEVKRKTKGQHLDTILKVAARTGRCMDYQNAARIDAVVAGLAHDTGRRVSEIKALV